MIEPNDMADNTYSFNAKPKAIAQQRRRKKYRPGNENEGPVPANIMYDRRVVRGNTYAAQVVAANVRAEEMARQEASASQQQNVNMGEEMMPMNDEVEPVEGRKHIDVQTDNYLEELTDRRPEVNEETQTEAFMDRPPLPLFIPSKTGLDKETQVEDDLFDFDLEVEPILEVLVGKTMEQSMQEVLEEEELAMIRRRQEEFEQTRNVELAEVQRLEAEAKRSYDEKERRKIQESERIVREKEVGEKVKARAYAKDYLGDLHENVFGNLMETGHFYDPLAKEVEEIFMPWISDGVVDELDRVALSRKLTTKVLEAAVQLGNEQALKGGNALNESALKEAEQEKSAYARLAEIERKAEEERLAAESKEGDDAEAGAEEAES